MPENRALHRSGNAASEAFRAAHHLTKATALIFASQQQQSRSAFMLLSSWTLQEAGRVAQAPEHPAPDEDFNHTTLRRRRVTGERAAPWAAPDTLSQHALATAVSADETHAALSAHQRALARHHGAEQHKDTPARSRRGKEAAEHAQAAAAALQALANASSALPRVRPLGAYRDPIGPPLPPRSVTDEAV